MSEFSNEIRAYALKNAMEFGKAESAKILPKLFQHGLDKSSIKDIMPKIQQLVKEINSLSEEDRAKEFEEYKQYIKEKEEQEQDLPPLDNVSNKMVFRLAPFPSGALHLGNAKTYLLNAVYAEKYNAKTILVMDDTIGSEEKPITEESYDLIQEAFQWLKVNYDEKIIYKSDRIKIYYEYAEKLIEKDKAYVCHCSAEVLRENRAKGIECGCRQFPKEIQMKRWKEMFKQAQGDAVLRIKTSMQHPNPAFRDRVLFRISQRKHPRVGNKYTVWPTLEMTWAVDDHLLHITHIIRGNDLMIETDMEKYIWDIFGWKHPQTIHTGLVRIEGIGAKMSKSKAQKEVKSGEFSGWDDPRTWSIQSLARRGFKPEAIREFVREIGLNKADIAVPVDSLYAINRKMIDAESDRYSFIENPVEIKITDPLKIKEVEVPLHPDKKEKRTILVRKVLISNKDFDTLKGSEIRLIHLYNLKLEKKPEGKVTSVDNKDIPKINWVSDFVQCTILMPDGATIKGICESAVESLKKGQVIQFERFGFVRFDKKKDDNYEFWFAHR